mgnify:CR=1 FL=1
MAYYCYKCGNELEFAVHGGVQVGRLDTCDHCGANLHCCKNCYFYDPSLHNECRESYTDFIRDREAPNFCSSYRFKDSSEAPGVGADVASAKSKLEDLFKNLK